MGSLSAIRRELRLSDNCPLALDPIPTIGASSNEFEVNDARRLHGNGKIQAEFHSIHFDSTLRCLINTVHEMLLMKVFHVHVASNARVLAARYTKAVNAKLRPMFLGNEFHTRSLERRQLGVHGNPILEADEISTTPSTTRPPISRIWVSPSDSGSPPRGADPSVFPARPTLLDARPRTSASRCCVGPSPRLREQHPPELRRAACVPC